ncbi:MAG: NAD(P)(+) transhydrogenase (Re/Si-specific) subunit beta [Dokdonella sp.]|uniref:NAD(P)(+) transhydrogenase (Re/Si-specific) subunit beta n=1 Tax=Dokdonella sp. TaxID=2291710 RepID=UPI0025C13866|nr:NAD(P)(+) transhydrogenase (Re/Si-specific) subunit beta [Dokdonella sp.]MBX3700037.1 NAD(P)(+) transhydrogenase (Re/Si-specific) subunit beta [Dokdonella sp.]MCW5578515.1 NAD(P)(+) transhydrogenase (Re/Si-specific) subunit beta [Dokdonella sp.]
MDMHVLLVTAAKASYLLAALLFILGIKRMSSPVTARAGIKWAGVGMVIATLATFAITGTNNLAWIVAGIAIGVLPTWLWGRKVAMTDMPQMVALFNGMGGGSAAAIGAIELLKFSAEPSASHPLSTLVLAVIGALIGSISMTGSIIAWAKLDGRMDKRFTFAGQQAFNFAVFAAAVLAGLALVFWKLDVNLVVVFFVLALAFGVLMTLPIGGADMPVVISLYNAFTGLAVAFEGYAMGIEALIVAGMVVGAAGTFLTQLMAKAMNRPISGVLFSNFGGGGEGTAIAGAQKPIEAADAASLLYMAEKVIIVPGYGMAVAQAQHKIWELSQALIKAGKEVKFAIHPVAGRMPGHMNVLLAEAGVPYDLIADMDEINPEFKTCDVAIVIGANDVVNPAARTDKASPIYGMPILDVVEARQTIVIKRGKGTGFAGIENALFYADHTRMLYADGKEAANQLISELKMIEGGGGH